MVNGLYAMIMLVGLWSLALIHNKYKLTGHYFYRAIFPTNALFWLFITVPLLSTIIFPSIKLSMIAFQYHFISCSFFIVIPMLLERIFNRSFFVVFWSVLGGINMALFLVAMVDASFFDVARIVSAGSFIFLFIVSCFIWFKTSMVKTSIEYIFMVRFFWATAFFIPGIILDITSDVTKVLYNGLFFTPFFYLVIVAVLFTLPHDLISGNASLDMSAIASKYSLTKRESELLPYIIQGQSNQEIADQLHISLSTVKRHVHHIFTKMNVKNRFELSRLFVNVSQMD